MGQIQSNLGTTRRIMHYTYASDLPNQVFRGKEKLLKRLYISLSAVFIKKVNNYSNT